VTEGCLLHIWFVKVEVRYNEFGACDMTFSGSEIERL